MKALRFVSGACLVLLLAGCKLAVMVPPGGMIQSSSGIHNCDGGTEGKFCTFDLTAAKLPYAETFTVTAKPGYRFLRWQNGKDFNCGDSANPACTLTISNNDLGRVILGSFWTGYLMPVFEYLGIDTDGDGVVDPHDADDDDDGIEDGADNCPLTWPNDDGIGCPDPLPDAITANGKEWAQPFTFLNLSWEQVYEVCPPVHGLNMCNGQLNGVDLRGWRWATTAEVQALLQSYSGTGGGCAKWSTDFVFATSPMYSGPLIAGWVSETSASKYIVTASTFYIPCFKESIGSDMESGATGSWFYRLR